MSSDGQGLYLLMISVHGLIRGHDLELGRDADTGGQTKYVVDLAKALSEQADVAQVDLATRLLRDPAISKDYAEPREPLTDTARIVRIEAGPDRYLPKEQLWDHLDSFADNLVAWLQEQPRLPDVVHSHYADAGYVGARVAGQLGVPLVHTGHSLGRDKRKRLLAKGLSADEIETTYNMSRRVDAEEQVLANAALVITSTHNEIEEQYGLYNYYNPERMTVIPPGTDLKSFHPPGADEHIAFSGQLARFLKEPKRPMILALSRPDERKNILTLLEAYGESRPLQELANLVIVAGSRDDIADMDPGARGVLSNVLMMVDLYDLYGRVAVPKRHRPDEVPEIYRLAAASRGVFVNPALTEPFGLTLLEAAASGLPLVATENGGPVDIIGNCHNGRLVDPLDKDAITSALLQLLCDRNAWDNASRNGLQGVRQHYSWQAHAEAYLERIRDLPSAEHATGEPVLRGETFRYRDRAVVTDLDQTLVGDPRALKEFLRVMQNNRKCVTFGIATGRRIDSALALMRKHRIPTPDVLISSTGTRIHYGKALTEDDFWNEHIDHQWTPDRCHRLLRRLPGIKLQEKRHLSLYKLSYYYDPERAPGIDEINTLLRKEGVTANLISSFGQYLDVIPARASKGLALRYVSQRLDIPLEQILVAGGSGADEDMMRGNTLAVVVANRHHEELEQLDEQRNIYFAGKPHASGLLEAIDHYDFFQSCRIPHD